MLCEKCGANIATTHIRTVVNGEVQEKHLCSHCAASEGYSDIKSNNLTQMLTSMFGDTVLPPTQSKILRCDCCGSTYDDIANTGKCGCSECYSAFYNQLLPYLKRVHGSTEHMGKKLKHDISDNASVESIDQLREQLSEMIKQENYEQAAVLRDKIKALQEGV